MKSVPFILNSRYYLYALLLFLSFHLPTHLFGQPDIRSHFSEIELNLLTKAENGALPFEERHQSIDELLKISKLKKDTALIIEAKYTLVKILHDEGNYFESIELLDQLIELEKNKSSDNFAFILNKYGLTYYRLGIKKRSIDNFRQAMEIFEKNGNDIQRLRCLNNISSVYFSNHDYEKSIQSLKSVCETSKELNIPAPTSHYNLGTSYLNTQQYELARQHMKESIELATLTKDWNKAAIANSAIGALFSQLNQFQLAEEYLQTAEQFLIDEKLNTSTSSSIQLNRVENLIQRKKWSEAQQKLTDVMNVLTATDIVEGQKRALELQQQLFKESKNYQSYILSNERLTQFNDSIKQLQDKIEFEVYDKLASIRKRNHELNTNQQQLIIQEQESNLQIIQYEKNLYQILFASIAFISLTVFLLFFFRKRAKETSQRNQELTSKTEQLTSTLNIKKDQLTDLAIFMGQNKELLAQIKTNLKTARVHSSDPTQIDELILQISEVLTISKDQQTFHELISDLNDEFISSMKKKYPKLTSKDLRLISLIKLNLSSKEIASLINISAKSVDVNRYRLRKKIGLSKGESIKNLI